MRKAEIVGRGPGGEPVIDGATVFRVMDSEGAPLWAIRDYMRSKGWAFDTLGFVKAAVDSGNYTREKIVAKIREDLMDDAPEIRDEVLRRLAVNG